MEVTNLKEIIDKEAKSKELILGSRPEDIHVSRKKPIGEFMEVEIYAVEPLGAENIIDLKIEEYLIKAKGPPDFEASIGEKMYIKINKEKIHIFDKTTKQAIV